MVFYRKVINKTQFLLYLCIDTKIKSKFHEQIRTY